MTSTKYRANIITGGTENRTKSTQKEGDTMTFRELLKASDCSGSRLARAIGVTRQTISNWQDGKSTPNIADSQKIAKVLGVPLETVAACFVA